MNPKSIESLFLKQDASPDALKINAERLAGLKNDSALQMLHKMKKVECIINALANLEERKFEEAYAEVKLLSAITDYEESFAAAEESVQKTIDDQSKQGGSKPVRTIKY
jgi:hypothetical protein